MEMFEVIGRFGPWQRRVFIIFSIVNIAGMMQNLSMTFFAPKMSFRCVEPAQPSNWTEFDNRCEVPLKGTNQSVPCTRWEYDTSEYSLTLVNKWDLVCDREWLISLTNSVYMLGFLLAVIFFGQLSDSYGRFPSIVTSYVITIVSMLLTLLCSSFTMFLILRFFHAFGRTALTTVGFVLLMEMVGSNHRTGIAINFQLAWTVGFCLLPVLAYFVRHWFWLQFAITLPFLPLLFTFSLIPESPRWLLMRGRTEELEKLLKRAAKVNGKELKLDVTDLVSFQKKNEEKEQKPETLLNVVKRPRMRRRLINVMFMWLVNSFSYYGLSFNTNDLGGNPYINCFLSGVVEFPAYLVLHLALKKWGRRPIYIAYILGVGAADAALIFTPPDMAGLSTTFAMVGKMCITGSFGLLYLYTSEIFPTVVRNVTLGSCSMSARIGSILAPFVRELGKATHPIVPNLLYGFLTLTSGILALALPETKDQKLPDTLDEGEEFGRKETNSENHGQHSNKESLRLLK